MSDYLNGCLRIINLDIKSKALLIGRVFRFFEASEAPWKDFMRYYIGRALGINDNSRQNSDIPTPFYSHLLRVLREFAVDLGQPCTSKMYYLKRIEDCVTPVQARSELAWNQRFGPGLIWKEIWKDVARIFNYPVLRDFDWRTVHRVLPVNFRVHKRCSRISSACARCGERVETLEHTLIHCSMVKEMWMFILKLCNRIDASVLGLSERNMLLGCFPRTRTRDLLRYLISGGKFSAWKERVSHQYRKDEKINSLVYFKNYVRNRLETEQCIMDTENFESKWCINNVLACVINGIIRTLF